MWLPESVEIVEVGPRDGLQSLRRLIPTEVKVQVIETLARAGLRRIEVTSFVRPDVVPQLADADALVRALPVIPACRYRALVANRRGALRAAEAHMSEVVALTMASEPYSRLNQQMSISDSLRALEDIVEVAEPASVHVVGAVGMALFCPYAGDIDPERALGIVRAMHELGIDELYVASSAGLDGPRRVYALCSEILARFPTMKLGVHLHNTNGMALANATAALQAGVRTFEGAICGLGGGIRLPNQMAVHGNVATEDLVNLFAELEVDSGIDLERLIDASGSISKLLDVEPVGFAVYGGSKAQVLRQAKLAGAESGGVTAGEGWPGSRRSVSDARRRAVGSEHEEMLALHGIRVLDLSNLLAAPMATMHLADFGADVIKVEDPVGGDELRNWGLAKNNVPLMHKIVNRNKRNITLNLRVREGQELARRLARSSDVVVENYRPGTLERWGLDFDTLRADNPRLVMASITGYGRTGPYAHRRGFGSVGEAFSGFAAMNGQPNGPPILPSFGLGDTSTAIFGAYAIMVALFWARESGEGQHIDLSLYDGLLTLLGSSVIDYDQLGVVHPRSGSRLPFAAPRNIYETVDHQWVVVAGSTQRSFESVAKALRLDNLLADPRFANNSARIENVEALDNEIQTAVRTLTCSQLLQRLEHADAAASRIFDAADIAADPHISERGSIVSVPDPDLESIRMQGVAPRLSLTPGRVRWAGRAAGAHNDEIFKQELALTDDELVKLARLQVI
jgi:crotonobetainyl-CoA:carnitine CoA-transferase CaiB-like acyl-CoA transferase/isopropylmalate/homocitrate/citramalate synthase